MPPRRGRDTERQREREKKFNNKGVVKEVFYVAGGGGRASLVKEVFRPRTLALLVAVA
jgi:hypothetical protein